MNVKEMTARVISGESPRFIIESTSPHRWEQLGKKIDAVVRAGGIMAGAASPMVLAYAQRQELRARRISSGPSVAAYASGYPDVPTAIAGKAPGFDPETLTATGRKVRTAFGRGAKAQLAVMTLAGAGAAGVLGAASVFRKLGAMVDKRQFARSLKGGIRLLLKEAAPAHRGEISRVTVKLVVTDPFTEPKKYSALLQLLLHTLTDYRDVRYHQHIESICKFLEVMP